MRQAHQTDESEGHSEFTETRHVLRFGLRQSQVIVATILFPT